MCGIAGLWSSDPIASEKIQGAVRKMTDALAHRGPDDSGLWLDELHGVGLGHRRLSIIDLSPEGHQPMVSASGRYVISFNGEVFNHRDVLARITASGAREPRLRGHSDTEVMLAAIETWGLERAVDEFIGMFAFALWDRREKSLSLVRDRLGIKPVFYGVAGGALLFGSELHALVAHPNFERELDLRALTSYLQFGYVPAPKTIYRNAHKLEPGVIATFLAPRLDSLNRTTYWSAFDVAHRGRRHPFAGTERDAVDELERRLEDAVRLRLVSDVPIGAFLSGGTDSSTVVALMQKQNRSPVRTFSIANELATFDESESAASVARHLGTDHTELRVTASEAVSVIPLLPRIYDEPFADSSQIPTFLVSRLAREHVTVALSGDGGDELFGGYNRHVWAPVIWGAMSRFPIAARRAFSNLALRASSDAWERIFRAGQPFLPGLRTPGAKVHKLAGILDAGSANETYRRLVSLWERPERLVRGGQIGAAPPSRELEGSGAEAMMLQDLVTYLPDDILTKVDRASMAVSLEARVPLLDHRVVEFAWTLPLSLKVRGRTGKWILKEVLARHVPVKLVERPKTGFGVPLAEWLRGPLREWANDLLNRDALAQNGYLEPAPIMQAWSEHLSGRRDLQHPLWAVLVFQAWLSKSR